MFTLNVHAATAKILRSLCAMALLALAILMLGSAARAQDERIVTETSLVQLSVGVVDKQGNSITNLSQNDFVVYEDGVRRPIVHFEPTDAQVQQLSDAKAPARVVEYVRNRVKRAPEQPPPVWPAGQSPLI